MGTNLERGLLEVARRGDKGWGCPEPVREPEWGAARRAAVGAPGSGAEGDRLWPGHNGSPFPGQQRGWPRWEWQPGSRLCSPGRGRACGAAWRKWCIILQCGKGNNSLSRGAGAVLERCCCQASSAFLVFQRGKSAWSGRWNGLGLTGVLRGAGGSQL